MKKHEGQKLFVGGRGWTRALSFSLLTLFLFSITRHVHALTLTLSFFYSSHTHSFSLFLSLSLACLTFMARSLGASTAPAVVFSAIIFDSFSRSMLLVGRQLPLRHTPEKGQTHWRGVCDQMSVFMITVPILLTTPKR